MDSFKVGEKVKLVNCGNTYPTLDYREIATYISRYEPINATFVKGQSEIYEGYDTPQCLDLRTDLEWKIAYIKSFGKFNLYFLRSNKRHFLVGGNRSIEKIVN